MSMDLNDISEYFMLHIFGQRNSIKFCEQEGIHSMAVVFNLLKVQYFLNTNDECWTMDVSDSLKPKQGIYKRVEIGMYFLKQGRFIAQVDKDKHLGGRFELTNKGRSLLYRYAAFLRDEQRKISYKIKESHVTSRELKENE